MLASAQQYNFQYYSVAEGLAQSQVYSMIEDHDGYLWMGTQGGGLNRFDGQEFETFTLRNGLINNYVDALYETDGQIYIGARNGMSIFKNGIFKNYFVSKEQDIKVTAFQKHKGDLLVGTDKGVYIFNNGEFVFSKKINATRKLNVACFFTDSKNRLWIGTRKGAILYDGNTKRSFDAKDGFTPSKVTSIAEDKKGNIWFSTYNGAYVYDGKDFKNLNRANKISSNYLNHVLVDDRGLVWLSTQDNGVSIWNPADSVMTALNAETGLCNNNVKSVLQDSWGNLWIATSGGGVCKYTGQQFLHLNISQRPADNLVYSLCQDSAGSFWFAAADDGVVRMDSTGFTPFGSKEGFVNSKTKAMLKDSKGRLWFGTNDFGVAYFNGQTFEFLKYKNRTFAAYAKDFEEDKSGNIYVASSSEGVFRITPRDSMISLSKIVVDSFYINDSLIVKADTVSFDSIVFTYRVKPITVIKKQVNALHFDRLGRLWFATTSNGIGYYNENGVVTYDQDSGLPGNSIRSITEDEKGHLWIGTAGYGIARMNLYTDSLNLQVYNENDGLSSGNVYLLAFDNSGALWVGCGRGVDRLSLDEEQNIKAVKSFGKADGFLGVETCQNAVIKDRKGNLWFGTIDGVTQFLPGTKAFNEIAPKLRITGIELNYEPFQNTVYKDWLGESNFFKNGLELPHHKNRLGFEFNAINLSNPQKVVYQWMLEGLDQNWSKQSNKNSETYSSLPPGNYTFKLRAFNEDGVYNDPPLQTSFQILTPIWQRWWFILSAILLIIGLPSLLVRRQVNRIRRKAQEKQAQLELENNLLQLEQKALQLQMNPHFIFNALNTVQSLFMANDQNAARQLISKFAKLMRSILENSRATTIPLQKEIDLLDNYLSIEQFSRPGKFNYQITIAPDLDAEEVNIPPMMIQPFVENAIIHGVNHLKSSGLITLNFQKENTQLLCTVTDNGIGRKASEKLKEKNARKHKSIALEVTKERLDFLNQSNKSKSLVINDLNNESGSISGTEVLIRLPLEEF